MNLGEFIIKIGTQGDTKALDEAIKKMEEAEKKTRKQIKLKQDLAKATTEEEKALIKKNAAQQDELDKLKDVKLQQSALQNSMHKTISTSLRMIGAISATVVALDRLGNSLLKSNQMYITFERQTDMSITRLNRMAGLARLSGMNLSPEQVAGDLQELQHKIFRFERFGEGAQTFGMLGINPRGMDSDKLLLSLRKSLKGYSGRIKSEYLSELGLSQEWLSVLNLSDEKFKEFLKTSSKLQLNEKERKQLAKFTAKQQENNMRWELARQKLLISVMPFIQQIMEVTSKIALKISDIMEKNPKWLYVVKDILLLLAGSTVIKTITTLATAFKGLGALMAGLGIGGVAKGATKGLLGTTGFVGLSRLAKQKGLGAVGGVIAKRLGASALGLTGGPIGAIFSIAMAIWTVVDILNFFKNKDEDKETVPEPVETGSRYAYHNVNANMTNNFFNNPQPAREAISQLSSVQAMLLARQTI